MDPKEQNQKINSIAKELVAAFEELYGNHVVHTRRVIQDVKRVTDAADYLAQRNSFYAGPALTLEEEVTPEPRKVGRPRKN